MNSNSSSAPSTANSNQVSADAISRRAYELWEKEGRPEGDDMRHWLLAEQELGANRQPEGASEQPSSPARGASVPVVKSTGSDARPLQGTRAAGAANRENKRGTSGTTAPFERAPATNGGPSSGMKRQ